MRRRGGLEQPAVCGCTRVGARRAGRPGGRQSALASAFGHPRRANVTVARLAVYTESRGARCTRRARGRGQGLAMPTRQHTRTARALRLTVVLRQCAVPRGEVCRQKHTHAWRVVNREDGRVVEGRTTLGAGGVPITAAVGIRLPLSTALRGGGCTMAACPTTSGRKTAAAAAAANMAGCGVARSTAFSTTAIVLAVL